MTGVKVDSKPAEFHLPLAMTGVKVASKPAEIHLPLAMTNSRKSCSMKTLSTTYNLANFC